MSAVPAEIAPKRLLLFPVAFTLLAFFSLLPVSALEAKIYYTGKWEKLSDRAYLFKRERSSHNAAILMNDYVIMIDAGQEPESGK